LDLWSLTRLNYSPAAENRLPLKSSTSRTFGLKSLDKSGTAVPLLADRDLSREMLGILENAYGSEERARANDGRAIPEPKYERYQINVLEASAETLRDLQLIKEVHDWEKNASKDDGGINWEGRAVAREITSQLSVEETKERLQHFLESQKVASLHLGNHRTGTLREVEARTVTEYFGHAVMDSREQRKPPARRQTRSQRTSRPAGERL